MCPGRQQPRDAQLKGHDLQQAAPQQGQQLNAQQRRMHLHGVREGSVQRLLVLPRPVEAGARLLLVHSKAHAERHLCHGRLRGLQSLRQAFASKLPRALAAEEHVGLLRCYGKTMKNGPFELEDPRKHRETGGF